jgi:hypothetical protein
VIASSQMRFRSGQVEPELSWLSRVLQNEYERASTSFLLCSLNVGEVKSLYGSMADLMSAQAAILKMIASENEEAGVLELLRHLASIFEERIEELWRDRHFRAAEVLARSLSAFSMSERRLRSG